MFDIFDILLILAPRKISYFHLISWFINFAEGYSFQIISGDSPETLRKLCLSAKFPYQEITWNYGILRSVELFRLVIVSFTRSSGTWCGRFVWSCGVNFLTLLDSWEFAILVREEYKLGQDLYGIISLRYLKYFASLFFIN